MDYRRIGDKVYIRIDKNEDIIHCVKKVCEEEHYCSAIFHGIGACGKVCISTYLPETESFLDHWKEGLLELISLDGNISHDSDGRLYEHSHAMFSYLNESKELSCFGGHLKKALVSYTAEIVLEELPEEGIGRMTDPYTGISVWNFA
ncbi:MAG: DNA-binding protein [Oscillospiraceae bacterium]|nr:DNA-binding protein [Oscillospiraceae bacterium]